MCWNFIRVGLKDMKIFKFNVVCFYDGIIKSLD